MARVQVQVTGGGLQEMNASTVGDVKKKLGVEGYSAQVNGDPAANDHVLSELEFVTLTEAVKGGA